jgi:hypothetical protein
MTAPTRAWCEKFEMSADSCAHCTGRTGDPELLAALGADDTDSEEWGSPPSPSASPWVTAKYRGTCAGRCKDPEITPGDWIRACLDGGWLCVTCGGGNPEGDQ